MRKIFLALMVLLLIAGYLPMQAFGDMTDKATLGGIDSSGNYHWRVDANGIFKPGTDDTYDIGTQANAVQDIVADGTITFEGTLLTTGIDDGGVSNDCETGTTSLSANYSFVEAYVTTRTLTLGDGYTGQVIIIMGKAQTDTGTLTLDASTQTGWDTITIDSSFDTVTLLYTGDTYGWVVIGEYSVTVNN